MIIDARGQVKKGKEALKKYNSKVRYDKNIILYGPPGTGKTYNTAIYAVAICDEKTLSEVEAMPYDEVFVRYRELRSEGRIAFTTFHQSYGYEEFIEGIKPVLDGTTENIGYTIEDGVFKSFCKNAELPSDIEVDHNAKVWKVVLKSGDKVDQGNSVKTECFKDGKIMFNWKSREEEVGSNNVWLIDVFRERMNIGDFVVAYAGKSTNIDAIGRVTGEAVYDAEKGSYR